MDVLRPIALRSVAALLTALVLASAGCSSRNIGTTAASFIRATGDRDPNIRHIAYQKLADPRCFDTEEQKADAARRLAEALKSNAEPKASRAEICRTLGVLGRPEGREALAAACEDDEPLVRAEACRSLGAVGTAEDVSILTRHMTADAELDCRIAAIEGLGALRLDDPRVELQLADGMESDDPAVRVASLRAVRSITGRDFGVGAEAWRKHAHARLEQQAKVPAEVASEKAAGGDASVSRTAAPRR